MSPTEAPAGIAEALGAEPAAAYVSERLRMTILKYDSEEAVRSMSPDFSRLCTGGFGGVGVTAASDSKEYDFVSRFFAPELGIDEDPVTGAAHTCLGPFWADILGKEEMVGRQISKRGGVVRVRTRGERVDLLGQAVTILRGELVV